jgi:2-polyprenyl-6-methoxyphenol hydroxylase-like FAD-dependent oxidoreductase
MRWSWRGTDGLVAALAPREGRLSVEVIDGVAAAGHSYAPRFTRAAEPARQLGVAARATDSGRKLPVADAARRRRAPPEPPLRCARRSPLSAVAAAERAERLLTDLGAAGRKVRWSHRLASLEPDGDAVVATVERLEKESGGYGVAHTEWAVAATQSFRAGFVIGADGHRSLVRRALGTPLDEAGPSQVFAIFECLAPNAGDEERLVLREDSVNALAAARRPRALELEVAAPG